MLKICHTDQQETETLFLAQLANFKKSNDTELQFALKYQYSQYYLKGNLEGTLEGNLENCLERNLENSPTIELCAIFYFEKRNDILDVYCTIFKLTENTRSHLGSLVDSQQAIKAFAKDHSLPFINLNNPILLAPCHIEKPWGEEVWYTGIEQRGQSLFSNAAPNLSGIPIPWLLDLLPSKLASNLNKSLVLLKILAPSPNPVFGDLYFEMHQEKQEVYVVTHIDKTAWPLGVGQIRYGFNQKKLQLYSNDAEFKQDFLNAVQDYQAIINKIDQLLDLQKIAAHYKVNQAVPVKIMLVWLREIPSHLTAQELALRQDVESFMGTKPLQVGDIVVIPCFVPHSLMHGVRTIEFQTPVYERSILYFAQKVLTQSHWDTTSALQKIDVHTQTQPTPENVQADDNVSIDKIVNYPLFDVFRYKLSPQCEFKLKLDDRYGLIIGICDSFTVDGTKIVAEQACFISCFEAAKKQLQIIDTSTSLENNSTIFLLAVPKIS